MMYILQSHALSLMIATIRMSQPYEALCSVGRRQGFSQRERQDAQAQHHATYLHRTATLLSVTRRPPAFVFTERLGRLGQRHATTMRACL